MELMTKLKERVFPFPQKKDIVRVNVPMDRKKRYRLSMDIPYFVVSVNRKTEEVVVVKVGREEDRGVEGWTLYFSDIEPFEARN